MGIKRLVTSYTYDDISLVPRIKSTIESRSIPIIRSMCLDTPIIASPMDCVCNAEMALALNFLGAMGVLHRFQSIDDQCLNLRKVVDSGSSRKFANVGVAVGISGDWKRRFEALMIAFDERLACRANEYLDNAWTLWINIDTANGFHDMVSDVVSYIKSTIKNCNARNNVAIKIIAGNIASREGYKYLARLGVDAVRVGISNGSPCTTGQVAGVGQGIVTTILECVEAQGEMFGHFSTHRNITEIIADGGIRTSGDFAKALALGANAVMCGSLFAGFDESPGDVIETKGIKCKTYRGMASHAAAIISNEINGVNKEIVPEGIEHYVPYKGSVSDFLPVFVGGLRSAMSYCNARNIQEFRKNAKFCLLTYCSHIERTPFIKNNGL